MAAPSGRVLVSITRGRCSGSPVAALWRQNPFSRSPQHAKSLKTSAWSGEKSDARGPVRGGPEYMPSRKAKNPMRRVGIAWLFGFPSGIFLFFFAKNEIDKRRLEQLKVRQRMWNANQGAYESERYRRSP